MNEEFRNHIERQSSKRNQCRVTMNGAKIEFVSELDPANKFDTVIYSTGETVIGVEEDGKRSAIVLTNRAAHEMRDFLNQRFPNATGAQ